MILWDAVTLAERMKDLEDHSLLESKRKGLKRDPLFGVFYIFCTENCIFAKYSQGVSTWELGHVV